MMRMMTMVRMMMTTRVPMKPIIRKNIPLGVLYRVMTKDHTIKEVMMARIPRGVEMMHRSIAAIIVLRVVTILTIVDRTIPMRVHAKAIDPIPVEDRINRVAVAVAVRPIHHKEIVRTIRKTDRGEVEPNH